MQKNSKKRARVNNEVQKELSNIIRTQVKDPRIHPMTSVVGADVTPDLKYCKAYISVLGTDEEAADTIKGLTKAVGYIRRALASSINLRVTPEITFILDQSIAYGVNMSKMIDEVVKGTGSSEEQGEDNEEYSADSEEYSADSEEYSEYSKED